MKLEVFYITLFSDAPYQDSSATCIWLIDASQTCMVTFLSNPLSSFVSFCKIGELFFFKLRVDNNNSIIARRAFAPIAKQPKFDVFDNLQKVSTGRKLHKRLLNT